MLEYADPGHEMGSSESECSGVRETEQIPHPYQENGVVHQSPPRVLGIRGDIFGPLRTLTLSSNLMLHPERRPWAA